MTDALNSTDRRPGLTATATAFGPATYGADLHVTEVNPSADPDWGNFVAAHPDGLLYHHPAWLQVLQAVYGHLPAGLVCRDRDGHVRGVLPLCQTHGLFTGRRLSSAPHTPTAGPLALDAPATAALVAGAVARARREPGLGLQLKAPQAGLDQLVDGLVCVPWEPTYVVDLPDASDALRFGDARNHGQVKRAVNKAARLGVDVRPAETEADLRAWYQLYLTTVRRHVVPPRPYRLFDALWRLLRPRGLMHLLLAETDQAGRRTLLAGSIFLSFGQTICFAFNGSSEGAFDLRPNDAIHWQAIHEAHRQGFRRYDLGEVADDNPGLARFKRKWGATPQQLYRYYFPARSDPVPHAPVAGPAVRWLVSAGWRRLPLGATALVGDWLYRVL